MIIHCDSKSKSHTVRRCRACKAFLARQWRKSDKGKISTKKNNDSKKNTNLMSAKSAVYILVRAKKLKKASNFNCLDCGMKAEVYDHRDYKKPLDIEPVCKSCNYKRGSGKNRDIL